MKKILTCLLLSGLLCHGSYGFAATTILAGGCFWCMEADFEKLAGVTDVVSGFTGGTLLNPTYNGDHSGHYEAVEITYDPTKISYDSLLNHFWINIDPFDGTGQFCDRGPSYLAAIFVANGQERALAERSRQRIAKKFPGRVVLTPILAKSIFYPIGGAESYHQNYYKTSPIRYKYYRSRCGRDRRLQDIWGD